MHRLLRTYCEQYTEYIELSDGRTDVRSDHTFKKHLCLQATIMR